jgi:DNA-binding beta-propeller fold protein YncE
MKKAALIFLLILFGNFYAISSPDWKFNAQVTVGKQPVLVFNPSDMQQIFYVFCAGMDAQWDGVPEEGDEPPSLWSIEPSYDGENVTYNTKKITEFDFWTFFAPFRPCIHNDCLYFVQSGQVVCFNYISKEFVDIGLIPTTASAISVSGKFIYLSERYLPDIGNGVVVYNTSTKEFTDTIAAHDFVQQTLPYGDNRLAVLSEGVFGANQAKLQLFEFDGNDYIELKTFDVGDCGNHLFLSDFYYTLYVTSNGSRELYAVNLYDNSIEKVTSFKMDSWSGPRESVRHAGDNYIITSAYNGYVYIIDAQSGAIVDSLDAMGKAESIDYSIEDNMFKESIEYFVIATPYLPNYDINSTVTVYVSANSTEVDEETNHGNEIVVYPNPISDYFNVVSESESTIIEKISIISLSGELLYSKEMAGNPINSTMISSKALGLASGYYMLHIEGKSPTGCFSRTLPLIITD